jgi:hypothetical protein
VRPGGLLVLELPHPDELFGGSMLSDEAFVDCWAHEEGDSRVFVEYGREGDEFDLVTQVGGWVGVCIGGASSSGVK